MTYYEDDNSATDSPDVGMSAARKGIAAAEKTKKRLQKEKYSRGMHGRNNNDAGGTENGIRGEGQKSAAQKKSQRKHMQREYADAARKKQAKETSDKAGRFAKRTTDKAEDLMGKLAENVKEYLEDHPLITVFAVFGLILVFVITGVFSSCSAMGGSTSGGIMTASYTAEDDDIKNVEADYVAKEIKLQNEMNRVETDYPGYDEYNYELAETGHNPYELAALLTVMFENYGRLQVQIKLEEIFRYQYKATATEKTEIRTRTETRWHFVTRFRTETRTGYRLVNGKMQMFLYKVKIPYLSYEPYEAQVEYEYRILNVKFTNGGIEAAVSALELSQEAMERYMLLVQTKGCRAYLFEGNIYANETQPDGNGGYVVPGEYLTDQQFANMMNEAQKYLGRAYVWGGSSPSTGFDCSGFVSYVINSCGNGWNYGRLTANGWLNATARVPESEVKPGDLVFFQGTYNTSGASHVGIVVDPAAKKMIHCGNPIQYASYDTPYWRKHAYCYGRLK